VLGGKNVLVVDDELEIRRVLEMGLQSRGYEVHSVASGGEACDAVLMDRPDLIILDLALPDMPGLEVCRRVRQVSQVPILVLSVRATERDKIAALDMGADDYVTKPFAMGELLARMRASLRRAQSVPTLVQTRYEIRELVVDLEQRRVTRSGEEIRLTPKEFELLQYMVIHADRILTHRQLLNTVWGPDFAEEKPLLRVHLANLRQKIEPVPARPTYIINEPGVGYRFCSAERSEDSAGS
jgi:two-component system KDP operon response regulator KdpE